MYVILGATGHIGGAAARSLLRDRAALVAVTRSEEKAQQWRAAGASAAVLNIVDVDALRAVFRTQRRALLINPPGDISGDADAMERETVRSILAALEDSRLERVVAESTYGARSCHHCGDLGILYDFERGLNAQRIPASIIRGAYYFSNWDASLESARNEGVLHSMFPGDFVLPMVAPADIGSYAADLLRAPEFQPGVHYFEGPSRYSPSDVARAFSDSLGRPVRVEVTPPDQWEAAFQKLGFSKQAAGSYARMTQITLEHVELPERPLRGTQSLQAYIHNLVHGVG